MVAVVADTPTVNPDSIKMILANGVITFLIKSNAFLNNGPKGVANNSPGCPILCNWFFD